MTEEQAESVLAGLGMANVMLWRLYDLILVQIRMNDPEMADSIKRLHDEGRMLTATPRWPETGDDEDGE